MISTQKLIYKMLHLLTVERKGTNNLSCHRRKVNPLWKMNHMLTVERKGNNILTCLGKKDNYIWFSKSNIEIILKDHCKK